MNTCIEKRSFTTLVLNILYLAFSVHIFVHEHMIARALGLERKQYADRVLLPAYRVLLFTILENVSIIFIVAETLRVNVF